MDYSQYILEIKGRVKVAVGKLGYHLNFIWNFADLQEIPAGGSFEENYLGFGISFVQVKFIGLDNWGRVIKGISQILKQNKRNYYRESVWR